MRKSALKKIPKPDKDKMAIFYGAKSSDNPPSKEIVSTVVESTVDKEFQNKDFSIKAMLKVLATHSQQLTYVSLYKRSLEHGHDSTDWIGYRELARENNLSVRTIQRAIEGLISKSLIKKTDFINAAEQKGTKYKVFLPSDK